MGGGKSCWLLQPPHYIWDAEKKVSESHQNQAMEHSSVQETAQSCCEGEQMLFPSFGDDIVPHPQRGELSSAHIPGVGSRRKQGCSFLSRIARRQLPENSQLWQIREGWGSSGSVEAILSAGEKAAGITFPWDRGE